MLTMTITVICMAQKAVFTSRNSNKVKREKNNIMVRVLIIKTTKK